MIPQLLLRAILCSMTLPLWASSFDLNPNPDLQSHSVMKSPLSNKNFQKQKKLALNSIDPNLKRKDWFKIVKKIENLSPSSFVKLLIGKTKNGFKYTLSNKLENIKSRDSGHRTHGKNKKNFKTLDFNLQDAWNDSLKEVGLL
jgi:hypothetical protein